MHTSYLHVRYPVLSTEMFQFFLTDLAERTDTGAKLSVSTSRASDYSGDIAWL